MGFDALIKDFFWGNISYNIHPDLYHELLTNEYANQKEI